MKRGQWVLVAAAVIATALAFGWAFAPGPVPVEIATVERGQFQQTVDEDGKTRVRERYVVSAPLAGQLARIKLKAGDEVKVGMPLAVLYPSAPSLLDVRTARELEERVGATEAALAQARAEVARTEAALEQAEADVKRNRTLAGEGFVSAIAREHAELEVRVRTKALEAARFVEDGAGHNLAQARAALLRARESPQSGTRSARWQIASPVKGRVLRVLQESETVVGLGTPLLEIADPGDLEIVVDVLSTDATRIPAGAPVEIDGGPGIRLEGRVRLIEPSAFTKVSALGVEEQRVNVVIDFSSAPESWRSLGDAYRVDVQIVVLSRANAVMAPVSALFRDGEEWAVFVEADGRAHKRAVKVGARTPLAAWIESGLDPGEKVIVYPSDSIGDGKRVKIIRGK